MAPDQAFTFLFLPEQVLEVSASPLFWLCRGLNWTLLSIEWEQIQSENTPFWAPVSLPSPRADTFRRQSLELTQTLIASLWLTWYSQGSS